jgi:short subunit dehydrogenase-like uncharacterized protein
MTGPRSWMLYGANGYTGGLIAQHAVDCGHQPVLAGRNGPEISALARRLGLPRRVVDSDDAAALQEALVDVELLLNAAGPFLHTATALSEACLSVGVHYLDISNELQVFRSLYGLNDRARRAGVCIMPGVGFGVVATNCLARYVSEAVGGAEHLEVATRIASAQPGPGAAATMQDNLPYGGWVRRGGHLVAQELFTGITTLEFPDGPCEAMPVPTGDLEAAFRSTGASNVTAYAVSAPSPESSAAEAEITEVQIQRSFGWARATSSDGSTATALLQTGDSYSFTPAASVRAVEETLDGSHPGALSPASAFGADFALSITDTARIDIVEMTPDLIAIGESEGSH